MHCGNCRPERHLYLNPEILRLPKRMPVPELARHLVCSKCGARNSETYNPICARPDARVGSGALSQRLRERSQTPTIAEASCRQFSCCVQLPALERRPPLGRPFCNSNASLWRGVIPQKFLGSLRAFEWPSYWCVWPFSDRRPLRKFPTLVQSLRWPTRGRHCRLRHQRRRQPTGFARIYPQPKRRQW